MQDDYRKLNRFLVSIFNEILRVEEKYLSKGEFSDLSVREMHIIEEVVLANKDGDNSSASIAKAQRITAGTLTTNVNTLVRKGYLTKQQDPQDRRIVRIYPTEKGIRADEQHQRFHHFMVQSILHSLGEQEIDVFVKSLEKLESFFSKLQ